MIDRPFIFSAPMVRALRDGRKTQTRRLLSPMNVRFIEADGRRWRPSAAQIEEAVLDASEPRQIEPGLFTWTARPLPHQRGAVYRIILAEVTPIAGDRLWVRESYSESDPHPVYRADHGDEATGWGWRPSIHIPRERSRITLATEGVRLERLQAITAADCEAEGVFRHIAEHSIDKIFRDERATTARRYFQELWEKLHGVGAWQRNPMVVASTFDVARRNIDAPAEFELANR